VLADPGVVMTDLVTVSSERIGPGLEDLFEVC